MTGKRVAIDTNVAVDILNGGSTIRAWITSFQEVLLPVPVVGELRFGALKSSFVTANVERIDRLIEQCRVLSIDLTTSLFYAELKLDLKRAGRPIPENDVWIAALCCQHACPLATADDHFSPVTRLSVIRPPFAAEELRIVP